MKKLRIIQIIDALSVGGAEVLAVNIANELAKNPNIESHFCATRKEGLLKKNINKQVSYLFLNRKGVVDLQAVLKLKRYIKKNKIQIIHAHSTSSFIAFCVKLLYPKVQVIWHDHYGEQLNVRRVFPLNLFSLFFYQIIVVNSGLKDWVDKMLLCKKVYLLNNFPVFVNLEQKTHLFGIDGKRIVCLAVLRPQKDHLNLLKAFTIFHEKNPDWTLHLVGSDHGDTYSDELKKYIIDFRLEDYVFIYGVRSDIKNILSQSSLGVLSSKSEGLPIALLEYGLANLPVLVTDVGECKKVLQHKNAVVESRNSVKFAKALQFLVDNLAIQQQIKKELNLSVNKDYLIENGIQKIIQMYGACLKQY